MRGIQDEIPVIAGLTRNLLKVLVIAGLTRNPMTISIFRGLRVKPAMTELILCKPFPFAFR